MYVLPLPRKWKFEKVIYINKMNGQACVDETARLPIYIPTQEGIYRSFRSADNVRLTVEKDEKVIFRYIIKGGCLTKFFVKETVSDEEYNNPELLLKRLNSELELSLGLDDIELSRIYKEKFDKLLNKALANCQHLKLDEAYDIGLDGDDENNSLSTIVGANSAGENLKNKGIKNHVFGIENLWQATEASHNCAFGFHSQWRATLADRNCSFGNETLDNNEDGMFNCAFGNAAIKSELDNDWTIPLCIKRNNAFGAYALYRTRGDVNNAFGYESLKNNVGGKNNLAIGNYSGKNALGSNEFYLDNLERSSNEEEKQCSLLYGSFDKDPNRQSLSVNAGLVYLPCLPQADPHKKGALWQDGDTVKISKG